ncbi:MAG: LLM class flavin-dependent oxidoreductase [Candidatus Thorarchaeota archaeon]
MKFAISLPNFGWFGNIDTLVEVAVDAEEAGWDGFFVWDHMVVFPPEEALLFADPWIALTAIAAETKKIRLGPMITPVPRRRPWKLAREAVTLDHYSKGRLILGVGLGAPPNTEFEMFGEETDNRIRAEKLEEGLDIMMGLWSGESFSHEGKHFKVDETVFIPKPLQSPTIPIWVGGGWPNKRPFKRAAKYDGVIPVHSEWPQVLNSNEFEQIVEIVKSERGNLDNYDVVASGQTSGTDRDKDTAILRPWADAGMTWWIEDINGMRAGIDDLRKRIRDGPPLL